MYDLKIVVFLITRPYIEKKKQPYNFLAFQNIFLEHGISNTYRLLDVLLYNTGIYLDEYTA